ncbi:MAG: VWA domain-containing protein [Armatimonadota bacterium]|nr:VWA domain-containing protein [Armatimonadota bacterium]
MTFTWPAVLWTLAVLPLMAWSVLAARRRQRVAESRLADAPLLARVAGTADPRRRWPVVLYLTALPLLLVGAARPVATIPLPVNRAALVIAIDTSQSMMADDVKPTRLDAAKAGALTLVRALPRSLQVGLVAFSDVGTVLVTPTTDRQLFAEAMDRLKPQQSTAVGSAVVEGLAILPERRAFLGERLTRLRTQGAPDPFAVPPPPAGPVPDVRDLPPAAIVLFSDGVTNAGIDPRVPTSLATEARVKVYAFGIGQPAGAVMPFGGNMVFVPFDAGSLQAVAQQTGGEYFAVVDEESVRRVARQLGRAFGWERRKTEISAVLAGAAALIMATGAALSLLWFRRVP